MNERAPRSSRRDLAMLIFRVLWYLLLLALIFALHDFPGREFRYWRM